MSFQRKKLVINKIRELSKTLNKQINRDDYKKHINEPPFEEVVEVFGSWLDARKEATKEEIISQIQECAKNNGGFPTKTKYVEEKRIPSYKRVLDYFDSWENAVMIAGFTPNYNKKDEEYWFGTDRIIEGSKKEILRQIHECAKLNHGIPTSKRYILENRTPVMATIKKHFDSWENALLAAGYFDCSHLDNPIVSDMKNQIFANLCTLVDLNETINSKSYDELNFKPEFEVIERIYGDLQSACNLLELDDFFVELQDRYTLEDIIKTLQDFNLKFHGDLTISNYNIYLTEHPHAPSVRTITRHGDSWIGALEKANLSKIKSGKFTDEQIIYFLRLFAQEHRNELTVSNYIKFHAAHKNTPSARTITRQFNGSWDVALEKAEIEKYFYEKI